MPDMGATYRPAPLAAADLRLDLEIPLPRGALACGGDGAGGAHRPNPRQAHRGPPSDAAKSDDQHIERDETILRVVFSGGAKQRAVDSIYPPAEASNIGDVDRGDLAFVPYRLLARGDDAEGRSKAPSHLGVGRDVDDADLERAVTAHLQSLVPLSRQLETLLATLDDDRRRTAILKRGLRRRSGGYQHGQGEGGQQRGRETQSEDGSWFRHHSP